MLIGMMVRPPGTVPEGIKRSVVAVLPAIYILPVDLISDCCLGDAIFLGIANKC